MNRTPRSTTFDTTQNSGCNRERVTWISHNRTMSRIEWSRYGGDDIESVVSMFVCRDAPNAFRIRPSRGDGGIDVCVPVSHGHVEIYQVKKFAENLTDNQKAQIEKSHQTIQTYASKRDWIIDRWHLALPLDPTPGNTEWFEGLAETGNFPCEWKGLSTVEGWAAKYSDVVDYYLGDWKDRLVDELARFVQLSGIPMMGSSVQDHAGSFAQLGPSDVEPKLAALRGTLNSRDPHFTYDIAVTGSPIGNPLDFSRSPLPAAVSARQFGDSYVTFWVFPRCAESLEERPITLSASIITAAGSQEHLDMEYFVKYGRVPPNPLRVEKVSMDLPGGLGGSFSEGQLKIFDPPDEPGEDFDRKVQIMSPDGATLAELVLTFGPSARGLDGTGSSSRGRHSSGFFEIEALTEVSDGKINLTMLVHRGDPTGHYPDEIEPALSFLQHFVAPNVLRISTIRGSTPPLDQAIPDSTAGRDPEVVAWNNTLLRYTRALCRIQQEVSSELRIPDLESEPRENIGEVLRAARLLDGETIEREWETIPFTLHQGATLPEADTALSVAFDQNLTATVDGLELELGTVLVVAEAAKLGQHHTDENGATKVELVPALGKTTMSFTRRESTDAAVEPEPETGADA